MDEPSQNDPALPLTEERVSADTAPTGEQQTDGADDSQATGQPQSVTPPPQSAYPPQPSAPFAPPTYPGMPGVPLSWSTHPPAPSGSLFAGAAGNPSSPTTPYASPQPGVPSVPAYPVYPGAPSVPLGTPMPGQYPTYPSYPASYPGYGTYPGAPLMPYGAPLTVPLQQTASPLRRALAEPFPAWLGAVLAAAAVVLVVVAFFAAVLAGQADWADGASVAGFVAFALAGLAVIVAVVRGALGRHAISMVALSAVLVVGLTAVGATGAFASPQIHGFQAGTLESAHDWQSAISEYQQSGEQAPNAPDIARTLDEQGEQQLAQGHYAAAIATFTTVRATYGQSGSAVARANTGTFDAYSGWVKSQAGDVPYGDAIAFFDLYRGSATCDSSCAGGAADVEAQALYQYGSVLATIQNYKDAVTQFEKLTADFPTSTYASQAHAAAAQAYLGLAQQETTAACATFFPEQPSAAYTTLLGNYQTLVSQYADTPQGGQAKTALAAPQDAVGEFQHAVSNATLFLSKHLNLSAGTSSNDYTTKITSSGTTFTFHKVALGSYYLTYTDNTGAEYYIGPANQASLFPIKPLCTNDIVLIEN